MRRKYFAFQKEIKLAQRTTQNELSASDNFEFKAIIAECFAKIIFLTNETISF